MLILLAGTRLINDMLILIAESRLTTTDMLILHTGICYADMVIRHISLKDLRHISLIT